MNGRGKYISLVLKKFYKKKKIVIEFTAPYISEKNSIAKQSWHILNIIKDIILIESKLFKEFWTKIIIKAVYLKNFLLTSFKKKRQKSFKLQKDKTLTI